MSEPVQPAAAPVVAPAAEAPAAPVAAATPAAEPAKRVFKNPYAKPAAAPGASPAPTVEAKPAAPPARSRALALAQSKLATVTTELAPLRERATKYEQALAPLAKQALEALPEHIDRAALAKKHGADALGLIEEVNYLRSIGALAPRAVAAPTATTTTAAPPVSGAPAPEADADLVALRQYQKYEKQSPTMAQSYLASHRAQIERGRAKAASH